MNVSVCCICQDPILQGSHALECGHAFHADCLIEWLRMGTLTCPLCRTDLHTPEDHLSPMTLSVRASYMRTVVGRRQSAPPALKGLIKRVRKAEEELRCAKRKRAEYCKAERAVLAGMRQRDQTVWRLARKIQQLTRLLGVFETDSFPLPALSV